MTTTSIYTLDFRQIGMHDVACVGGENGSLGQLFNRLKPKGVGVLDGFATAAEAYHRLLAEHDLEARLHTIFSNFDPEDMQQLAECGQSARIAVLATPLPPAAIVSGALLTQVS